MQLVVRNLKELGNRVGSLGRMVGWASAHPLHTHLVGCELGVGDGSGHQLCNLKGGRGSEGKKESEGERGG